ncbi:Imm44 family immunity protein [Desulfosporosinus sp. BICA1-9]|uniref:Imm44 family immunity protein n=1 Tax=Desulfosporosinus sp. BICA1-9 TaxID=1531958 RepID=UPI00054B32B8|nr:Imm44 family immunity protein [Desulfosporosinus sp. BICA1-9]KJS50658.1 MAG: hypothetical protein VR66_01575 [Peptococcaceae bacterium BRH_c23]KJS84334.1 MAG: hypothetical protein JL57_20755 [Desulfosporosinus sp. BICA1-9]HBW36736.1 dihydrolipoamide succinyltransferase [Desulfosporosinus sp.]
MDIFMSGEVDKQVGDIYREIRKDIEENLKVLKDNYYGSEVTIIGIIPIIVKLTLELEAAGFFKERQQFNAKKKEADFRLRIDLDKFVNSSSQIRKMMVVKNIIESIRLLKRKAKKDFHGEKLENDILNLLGISACEIDNLVI